MATGFIANNQVYKRSRLQTKTTLYRTDIMYYSHKNNSSVYLLRKCRAVH